MSNDISCCIKENNIKFLMISFVELNGVSRAKLVPANVLPQAAVEGVGFAGFAAGDLGQGPHDPDMMAVPDLSSMIVLPWQPEIAWLASNLYVNKQSWPNCPRTILQNVLEKAMSRGYCPMVGMETEFFLVREENGQIKPYDPLDNFGKPCYNQQALTRNIDLITRLVTYMNDLNWGVYQCDHEDANCQFEINWKYSEALDQCDRLIFARYLIRTLAGMEGLTATFMPKPFQHLTGNGCHYHLSIWDQDKTSNIFLDPDDGFGLSQMAYWFIGGMLKHARALAAIISPTVNSYKRLVTNPTMSGATWAPVYITYGGNNRTVMLRIPGPGRVEQRAVDGAANPYLAVAAILAAGMDGIDKQIDPGECFNHNTYALNVNEVTANGIRLLPSNLLEALGELEADEVICEALGYDFCKLYLQAKQREWDEYHNHVSSWEVERYLTAG